MSEPQTTNLHPNFEDKSGNPTFASAGSLNYSTNESRSLDHQPTEGSSSTPRLRRLWKKVYRHKS